MKLLSLVLLLTAISASSSYASHPTKLVEKNSVVLGHARFTVLAPEAIRMEYSPSDHFVDLPSLFAAKRTSELTAEESAVLKISVSGNTLTINTGKILLTYTNDGQWFRAGNPSAVITDSEHHFTANWTFGQKGSSNLGGTLNSLDHVAGPMPLKDGLLSKDGWYYIDDNGRFLIDTSDGSDFEHGFVKARDDWQHADGVDGFLFGYGLNYHSALKALTRVSGDIPMPRRYTLGAWYSRWWKYTSQDYRDIVEQFHQHDFPLDMIVMDMDWHQTPDYTGLSWNRALLPDAEQLLKDFHHEGLHVTLNDHPAGGVMPTETTYDAFMRAMGQDPATKAVIPYDAGNRKYLETLLGMTHTPLEKEGVDFWWVDWMGDSSHKFNQLDWINEYYFRHSEQSIPELNLRGQSFSRWADWGDQRHPIHFSGDTKILWSVLQFEVPFTSTAANVGCFYWSNDIGGFIDDTSEMNAIFKIKQGELIARWTQFGAVSPILRLHSANREWLDKRPWVYPSNIERSMQVSFHLRSEIFPYIYSSAWAAHTEATPLVKPLYYENPEMDEAYQNPQEYYFGDGMLAAPIVSAGTGFKHLGSQKVWFPPGRWFGWFDGEEHQAGVTETISADLNSFPLFVRGGYPLLTENYTERMTGSNPNQILIKIYPGNNGDHFQTDLYEDDGETKGYLSGDYALTHVETQTAQNGQTMDVTLAPQLSTQLDHIPAARSYVLQVMSDQALKSVMVDGQAVSTQYDESNGMTSIQTPHQSAKVTIVY